MAIPPRTWRRYEAIVLKGAESGNQKNGGRQRPTYVMAFDMGLQFVYTAKPQGEQ